MPSPAWQASERSPLLLAPPLSPLGDSRSGPRRSQRPHALLSASPSSSRESLLSSEPTTDYGMAEAAAAVLGGSHHAVVQSGEDNLNIYGYRTTRLRRILFWFFSVVSLGIFRLLAHWSPKTYIKFRAVRCSLVEANLLFVIDDHNIQKVRQIRVTHAAQGEHLLVPNGDSMDRVTSFRWFTFRKLKFIWLEHEYRFATPADIDCSMRVSTLQSMSSEAGLSNEEVARRMITYGLNYIEVKLTPIPVLLFKELMSPFYIFQVFSVSVWYSDDYAVYASMIVVMTLISIAVDVWQINDEEKSLRKMVHSKDTVRVRRDGVVREIDSDQLVVGDVLVVPRHRSTMHCDAVLMNGQVIVDESVLTGESVPITKTSFAGIDEDNSGGELRFNIERHSKHVLFCGTAVIQTRFYEGEDVQAIVIRTAYSTLKGQLVRSIMYPKPVDFRFTKDLLKFVAFLASIAGCGFIYTIAIMIHRGNEFGRIVVRALDIVTVCVPPALPAAMTMGSTFAMFRLKKKKIFCVSPSIITTCGAINVVCFDKTGTLTESGLDFFLMLSALQPKASSSEEKLSALFTGELRTMELSKVPPHAAELVKAIATCHSLTRIDGELNGDPLDLVLFNQTNWTIEEGTEDHSGNETGHFDSVQPPVVRPPPGHPYPSPEYSVVREFTFSSSLQRMSVIVGAPEGGARDMVLYSKGSPEKILSLCRPETVPANYMEVVNEYAQHGYRLIAVARRSLDIGYVKAAKIARNLVECDLELLGIVMMENRVMAQSLPVINQLNRASIRTVMVTGDNLLTAMSVARECGIIRPDKRAFILEHNNDEKDDLGRTRLTLKQSVSSSDDINDEGSFISDHEMQRFINCSYHIAVSGPTFAVVTHEYPELLERLVAVVDVFARMAPEQKKQIVNLIQTLDCTVSFCGDGANDCAALKAAHAGISLSSAEASIAAPFTSQIPNITCVPEIIREGRAALVTSFGIFKYMAGYSLTQFMTIMQLYWLSSNLTDMQFMYIDVALITMIAFVFGRTPPCEHISSTPPPIRLLSLASVASILGQLSINFGAQFFIFISTAQQPWFVPYTVPTGDDDESKKSMQGTAIFCVSIFQYLALAIIYSKGLPYRKTIFHNYSLILLLTIFSIVNVWMVLMPPEWLATRMEFDMLPQFEFRLYVLEIAIVGAIAAFAFETAIIDHLLHDRRQVWRRMKLGRPSGVRSASIAFASPSEEHHCTNIELGRSPDDTPRGSRVCRWLKCCRSDSTGNRNEEILAEIGAEPAWLSDYVQRLPAELRRPLTARSVVSPNGALPHEFPVAEFVFETASTSTTDIAPVHETNSPIPEGDSVV